MNILYQFNEKYAPYTSVSMTSLLENNREAESIIFWILGEGLSEDSINRLRKNVGQYSDTGRERIIKFIDTNRMIAHMKDLNMPTYRGSYAANIRLFVSEFIPKDVNRLLYLDSDTIINCELESVFDRDLGGKTIGMVYDSLGESHKKNLGISKDEGYYNSGVILFDMKKWRENRFTEKIIDHVKNVRAQYPSPDQDLINVVCKGEIFTLPAGLNYQPFHSAYSDRTYYSYYGKTKYYTRDEISDARENVSIYHCFRFIGEFPWHKDNLHPFNEIFDQYLSISTFCDYVKEKSDNGLMIRIEKVMYKILPRCWFLGIFYLIRLRFYKKINKMSEANIISKNA